jgi:hypothetical protein
MNVHTQDTLGAIYGKEHGMLTRQLLRCSNYVWKESSTYLGINLVGSQLK